MSRKLLFNLLNVLVLSLMFFSFLHQAQAIQPTLETITTESDGTFTYHFKIKIDDTVHVEGGHQDPNPDFFTIFNFLGLIAGSEKQPSGWEFSSSTKGITPFRGGQTAVNRLDVSTAPNITWSRIKDPVNSDSEISGFSVRTKIKETMVGEYGSQVTRNISGTLHSSTDMELKEVRIGSITTPKLPGK